jgi:hypothetical protein
VIDLIDERLPFASQVTAEILREDGENLAGVKSTGSPDVRGYDDIFHFPERMSLRKRLLVEDIQRGARKDSRFKSLDQRLFVDHGPSGEIQEKRCGFHGGNHFDSDQPASFRCEGNHHDQVVRFPGHGEETIQSEKPIHRIHLFL